MRTSFKFSYQYNLEIPPFTIDTLHSELSLKPKINHHFFFEVTTI